MWKEKTKWLLWVNCFPKGLRPLLVMLEVISTLGAGFVKNLDDAFGVLPDCQPSRGFSISTFDVTSLGALHALQKKQE